jgi:redox-sensitive bicupin YhaK (pirin superfamily)
MADIANDTRHRTGPGNRIELGTPFPLGAQWPAQDPFLFVAHHRDHYPAGTSGLGPDADLSGRPLGQDFGDIDGWNMYHGSSVPGFPQHPHRGFETVTYLRRGFVDHSDSLGATARFGPGDVQWMTAGSGVVHAEMFPLLNQDEANPFELFQIWLNLPAADKMVDPYFTMFWSEQTPRVTVGRGPVEVTVLAGSFSDGEGGGDVRGQTPPPNSWAGRAEAELAIWQLDFPPDSEWTLPAVSVGVRRTLYVYRGDGLVAAPVSDSRAVDSPDAVVSGGHGIELPEVPIRLVVDGLSGPSFAMLLQGRPIAEPVAQYGPFVMNDRAGIEQAFIDYQRTGFGGWPWADNAPVHPAGAGRFAVHADGRREQPG